LIQRLPHGADLVLGQNAVALLLWCNLLDHVAGVRFQPVAFNREVEHLPDQREHAVGHDRRALADVVEEVTDVAS
jgi:hypothetical protein